MRARRAVQALIAVSVFVVVGCNTSPSSMVAGPDPGAAFDTASTGPAGAPAAATESGLASPEVVTDTALASAVTLSAVIDGLKGGRLENDHVRLDIPSGAFAGLATVSVKFDDPTRFIVDLDIQPPLLDRFAQDVELRLKCGGKSRTSTTPAAWWWNPSDSLWYGLTSSQYDSSGDEVRVKLRHFSTYAAGGKAGW